MCWQCGGVRKAVDSTFQGWNVGSKEALSGFKALN